MNETLVNKGENAGGEGRNRTPNALNNNNLGNFSLLFKIIVTLLKHSV